MRKVSLIFLFLFVIRLAAQDEIAAWECPNAYRGQSLSIYNWSTYIAENTIPDFEAACGVEVRYEVFDNDNVMLDLLRLGNPGYDLVVPSGDNTAQMIEEGLAVPINYSLIPNFRNISTELLNPPYDSNNEYSLPYQWGTIAVGYRKAAFPDGIQSWEDVWNHDGTVAWLDDARVMMGIGLVMLGYDPNSINPAEILAARDYLGERGGNLVDIVPDSEGQNLLLDGTADVVVEYSGDIFTLIEECECDDFAFAIPVEGANIWVDNMVIPIDAANPELAMVFMDYVLHPQVSADISNFTSYSSPNMMAIEAGLILPELLANEGIYPSEETLQKLFYVRDLDDDATTAFQVAWDELLTFYQR